MINMNFTRRQAFGIAGALAAGAKLLPGQVREAFGAAAAAPNATDLVNAFEFEEEARKTLSEAVYATIAGGDRESFNKMTFRPRQCNSTMEMNLDTPMFGETLYTPIIVGPMAEQGRFHADGELATVRGAGATYTPVIVSSRSSVPFAQIVAAATTPVWFSVYVEPDARRQAEAAIAAGARVLFITVGASYPGGAAAGSVARTPIDWQAVNAIRQGLNVPVVIKGIATPQEATAAIQQGAQGIVVSNHGSVTGAAVDALEQISQTVNGRVPVLVDGSFRRGTDVLKALILGADAALLARPIAWGMTGYGADGVQQVLRLIQHELARSMGMLGTPTPGHLTRNHIRLHQRATV